ncbi:MAG: universal stress protein [Gemmataceae bacterium]|nr:universal stress protein [Gemmataceae bacterium]
MLRTVLVPLDGTAFGEQALPVATAIARRTGARVRLVHVHRPVLVDQHTLGATAEFAAREEERRKLARVAGELAAAGIPAEHALLDGPVVETLVRHAGEVAADLVVMTTHGRGPLSRAILGSVADPLVRHLTAPTLLVRPTDQAAPHGPPHPVRHLLVALDGSKEAEAVLPKAVELGKAMGARFTLLRVVESVPAYPIPAGVVPPDLDEQVMHLRAVAAAYLERVAAPLRGEGLEVRTHLTIDPDPSRAILEEAHALGCDLIALESHGRSGLARLWFGSVAGEVVRHGTTPVLTHAAGL